MKSTTEITVRNFHIDRFGHVNHARYVEFFEEARWRYLEENELLEPLHRIGAFHVVAKVVIGYRQGVRIGEILCIGTQIDGLSNHSLRVGQKAFIKSSGSCKNYNCSWERLAPHSKLTKPSGDGPFPAMVLLHGCGGMANAYPHEWDKRLADWEYASLQVDSFKPPRDIKRLCRGHDFPGDIAIPGSRCTAG